MGAIGGTGSAGGMVATQAGLLADVLRNSQAQMQALMKGMVSVDLQNRLATDKMAVAADIINAYGGSIDVTA